MTLDDFAQIALKCAAVRCRLLLLDRDNLTIFSDGDFNTTLKFYVEMSRRMKIPFVNRNLKINEAWRTAIGEITREGADFGYLRYIGAAA